MAITFIAVFVIIAAVAAVPIELDSPQQEYQQNYQQEYQTAPVAVVKNVKQLQYVQAQEYDDAEYKFNYAVNDEHTGDVKTQEETRKGDRVEGRYTLVDADGYQRIVEYTADDHNGFQAVVHREPIKGYQAPVGPVQQYEKVAKVAVPIVSKPIVALDNYGSQPSYNNADPAEYNYQH